MKDHDRMWMDELGSRLALPVPAKTDPLNRSAQMSITILSLARGPQQGDMNMYATSDLYLASYLVARGNRLDSFDRNNGKTIFNLIENGDLHEIIRDYYADCGLVSGLRLNNSIKNLKNLLYSNMDYNGKQELTHNFRATK